MLRRYLYRIVDFSEDVFDALNGNIKKDYSLNISYKNKKNYEFYFYKINQEDYFLLVPNKRIKTKNLLKIMNEHFFDKFIDYKNNNKFNDNDKKKCRGLISILNVEEINSLPVFYQIENLVCIVKHNLIKKESFKRVKNDEVNFGNVLNYLKDDVDLVISLSASLDDYILNLKLKPFLYDLKDKKEIYNLSFDFVKKH